MEAAARSDAPAEALVHATTIACRGQALLLQGASGAGKSALAMACIGLGAGLVSDDRTQIRKDGDRLFASPPAALEGLIEVRGIGLLRLAAEREVPVHGVVDLDSPETERLPPLRTIALLGVPVTLYRRVDGAHAAAALLACLRGARVVPGSETGPQPRQDT